MADTLKGTILNPTQVKGDSAYDIAVKHGFEGTEEEWLDSLRGGGDLTTDRVKFSEDIYTNRDVGNVKGSEGRKLLAAKGAAITEWVKSVFGETEDPSTPTSDYNVYCGSVTKDFMISSFSIMNLDSFGTKKKFTCRFNEGKDKFIIAVPLMLGKNIKVRDISCLDGDVTNDFKKDVTVNVNGYSTQVYVFTAEERLTSCFDFEVTIS